MAVFGKKDELIPNAQMAEKEAISSIIDTSMIITGELSFKGKTRVDGQIKGNVSGEHIILSKSGSIEGDLNVTTLVCHGKMNGNVKASLVTLCKECTVTGKIESGNLAVEPGASVDGEIRSSAKDFGSVQNNKEAAAEEKKKP
ncbi:MAG: cell shape determination protein CcmA [Deltaproteobacteria bacterium]|nr:MAG: cell shape determination protein CcmA [Deltaproteobacteria bacterium]